MNEIAMKNILAGVEVPSGLPLEEMARKLGALIGEVAFERDETGRFEEIPAFVAKNDSSGMTLVLFGIPEGETCDVYTLECSAETRPSLQEFRRNLIGIMNDILVEKEINARGYFGYSSELAIALTAGGINAKKPTH